MSRSLLVNSQLPNSFTHLAISCANYIYNRTVCKYTKNITPFELFYGHKPNVDYFRVFGSKAFYHIHKDTRKGDYNMRAKVGRMIGYSDNSNTYKIWDGRKIIETKDVVFNETVFSFAYSDESINTNKANNLPIEHLENDSIMIDAPIDQTPLYHTNTYSNPQVSSPQVTPPHTVPVPNETPYTGVPIGSLLNETNYDNNYCESFRELPFYFANDSSNSSSDINPQNETQVAINRRSDTGLNGPAWQNMPHIEHNSILTRAQARMLASQFLQERQSTEDQTHLTLEAIMNDSIYFIDEIPNTYSQAMQSDERNGCSTRIRFLKKFRCFYINQETITSKYDSNLQNTLCFH